MILIPETKKAKKDQVKFEDTKLEDLLGQDSCQTQEWLAPTSITSDFKPSQGRGYGAKTREMPQIQTKRHRTPFFHLRQLQMEKWKVFSALNSDGGRKLATTTTQTTKHHRVSLPKHQLQQQNQIFMERS